MIQMHIAEIEFDHALQSLLARHARRPLDKLFRDLPQSAANGFAHEMIFALEVLVETAIRHPGRCHHVSNTREFKPPGT